MKKSWFNYLNGARSVFLNEWATTTPYAFWNPEDATGGPLSDWVAVSLDINGAMLVLADKLPDNERDWTVEFLRDERERLSLWWPSGAASLHAAEYGISGTVQFIATNADRACGIPRVPFGTVAGPGDIGTLPAS